MIDSHLIDLEPIKSTKRPTTEHVVNGYPVPAAKRIELFSPEEWEEFVQEWAHSLKSSYRSVKKLGGAGDQGKDIVAFVDDRKFLGIWDLFQCKRYKNKLSPSDVYVEIGKLIYHTFKGSGTPPRKYYFMAPKGVGLSLGKLLLNSQDLKTNLKINWDAHCKDKIEKDNEITLKDELLKYFEIFDFTIFEWKTSLELVEEHKHTPFHSTRFGGGLPPMDGSIVVPKEICENESRYVVQLFEAYSDHKKIQIGSENELEKHIDIRNHFNRSREGFYSAEALRNFARDNVPNGTFESLQDDIYHGVIDNCEMNHSDGLERLRSTIRLASGLPLNNNPLCTATSTLHRSGICHQLANEDRLIWVQKKHTNGKIDD